MQTMLKYVILSAGLLAACLTIVWLLRPQPVDAQPQTPAVQDKEAAMAKQVDSTKFRTLTPQEAHVILEKGTERPFTGKYNDFFDNGVYACRQCGAMLYRSDDKFKAHCGWPAFDDEIAGAVERHPDPDGRRTEIVCANCGGHLGHVFTGEQQTEKNVRHCVNSVSLEFIPEKEAKYGRAIFAAGCFWGVEAILQEQPGVIETTVGYIGGTTENPDYKTVCSHTTGHAEAVEVLFDPARTDFETLAKVFFECHDPTQRDGQGPDIGDQYRSEIFYTTDEQKQVAEKLIAELKARGMDIATQVTPAPKFWPAEDYHQDYYKSRGRGGACHIRKKLW